MSASSDPQSVTPTSQDGVVPEPRTWVSDPKLRAVTEMILAMPIGDRLLQLEAEANFFASARPLGD